MGTRQRPWNRREAVLLLDGLLEIQNGGAKRGAVVRRLSRDLRQMAVNQGEDIDETFRNESGIQRQIWLMESAYVGESVSLKTSKLFLETVDLYRTDRAEYEKCLKEAKEMAAKKPTAEERFMSWLAGQVSPAQLSRLCGCYGELDSFCRQNGLLQKPLFETTDLKTVKKLRQAVERNQAFRRRHKRDLRKFSDALRYYHDYLREAARPQPEKSAPPASKPPKPSAAAKVSEKSGEYTVDFAGKNDVTYSVPLRLSWFGEVQEGFSNWKKLYIAFVAELCGKYPKKFRSGMTFGSSRKRIDLAEGAGTGMIEPFIVPGTNYALETNHSAGSMIAKMKYLLDLCGVDEGNVVITYQKKNSAPRTAAPRATTPAAPRKPTSPAPSRSASDLSPESVEKFLRKAGLQGVTAGQVIRKFCPDKGLSPAMRLLEGLPDAVAMPAGRWVHADAFVDPDEAEEGMRNILDRHFAQFGGYSNRKLLYRAAQNELAMFLNDNDCDDEESVFALAEYFFVKRRRTDPFTFSGQHIFRNPPEEPVSLNGLMIRLARRNDGILTAAEGKDFLDQALLGYSSLNQVLQIGSSNTFLQYDGRQYLLTEALGFDEGRQKALHDRLDDLFRTADAAFVILRDITPTWLRSLPALPEGLDWTHLLLQDVLGKFPDIGFRTVSPDLVQSHDTLAAAVVPTGSDLLTFPDVVALYLALHHELPLQMGGEELRGELRDAGMLQGNELIFTMPKALSDYRFAWTNEGKTVRVLKG